MDTGKITFKELCKEVKYIVIPEYAANADVQITRNLSNNCAKAKAIKTDAGWIIRYETRHFPLFERVEAVMMYKPGGDRGVMWLNRTVVDGRITRVIKLMFTIDEATKTMSVF